MIQRTKIQTPPAVRGPKSGTSFDPDSLSLEDLDPHFTYADLHGICHTEPLTDFDACRLFRHLPSGCETCWQRLSEVRCNVAELPLTTSAILAALRALTADDLDHLTPLQRLVRRRGAGWHLGFCRLVVDESLRLAGAGAENTEIVDLSLLLQLASEGYGYRRRHDFFALDEIRHTELLVRAAYIEEARKNLVRAMMQYMAGTADRELKAALITCESHLWWRRGHRARPDSHDQRVESLSLDERRAEVLTDRAVYLSLSGLLVRGRAMLGEARAVLDQLSSPCPSLLLTILHNLATTEANLTLERLGEEPAEPLDFSKMQAHLDAAADLYERFATPSLRAQREALLALASGELGRSFAFLYQTFLGFERGGQDLESAQCGFELLEQSRLEDRDEEAAQLAEELRQRLAKTPQMADYFAFVRERVRDLTDLPDLPTGPAGLLCGRLELLEWLTREVGG